MRQLVTIYLLVLIAYPISCMLVKTEPSIVGYFASIGVALSTSTFLNTIASRTQTNPIEEV